MRSLIAALLANLSMCSASSSSAPAESKPRARPKLQQNLTVVRQPAARGEPIALVGRQTMMCAIRQGATTACIGEIGLALEPKDPAADDGRYERTHTELPIAIEGLDLSNLDANGYTRCLVDPAGAVECWRRDAARRQGQHPAPLAFENVRGIAAEDQTCAILASGELRCTGDESCTGPDSAPDYDMSQVVRVPGIDKARVVAKALHVGCVVREDSTVACWGKTGEGGKCLPEAKPVPELGDVVDIAVDDHSACALRADNRVVCWGSNARRTLGVPEPRYSWTPVEVRDAHPAIRIEATTDGFAALRADGSIVAWGGGLLTGDKDPPSRFDYARPAVDYVALEGLVCALLDDGNIECAGWRIDHGKTDGIPRPPFEGKTPWVEAPLYRLAPRPEE